jgi:hypothetical protein
VLDTHTIEPLLPKPFTQLHQLLTKILISNGILIIEGERQHEVLLRTIQKVQKVFMETNKSNKQGYREAVDSMRPEIER